MNLLYTKFSKFCTPYCTCYSLLHIFFGLRPQSSAWVSGSNFAKVVEFMIGYSQFSGPTVVSSQYYCSTIWYYVIYMRFPFENL